MTRFSRFAIPCLVGLAAYGLAAGVQAPNPPEPRAPEFFRTEDPPYRGLDANLYVQVSAEYRACCLQAYNLAAVRLKEAVAAGPAGAKLAVVMDLDETVLDNSGYQAMLVRNGLQFNSWLWDAWERDGAKNLGLVPGAKDFIDGAKRLGVAVVYISNRSEKNRAETKKGLQDLDLAIRDETELLLAPAGVSDKTDRRKATEAAYKVVLYVGDNLRDFDEKYKTRPLSNPQPADLAAAVKGRKDAVDADKALFGGKYVILPNPAYGEWTKVLGRGRADADRLVPPADKK